MSLVKADERGRVSLGRGIISKYGARFELVPARREIVLVPVPKDPLKEWRQIAREAGISKLSLKEFKEEALRGAEEEIARDERRKARAGR